MASESNSKRLGAHSRGLAVLVRVMGGCAGGGMVAMMAVTTVDVVMRAAFNQPLRGAYDLVKILGGFSLFLALPYTTAIKGHVAVEYFFHKLWHRGRVMVDSVNRVVCVGLCWVIAWYAAKYGEALRASGEVTLTLQLPEYPVAYMGAASFAVVGLVVLHHLFYPGKELVHL